MSIPRRALIALSAVLAAGGCSPVARPASEQTYLPAPDNWRFRERYPRVDHLFNAFDYGHAIVYERLIDNAPVARLDGTDFTFVTQHVLRHPPSVPLEEAAIGPEYVKLVPEVAEMFEWAHMLHRQLYDAWAEYGLLDAERDERVQRAVAYYQSRRDLAFSAQPKSMNLMEGQPYSLAFRRRYPKFNGLLWSYHWLQMALYDQLMSARTAGEADARVDATADAFFRMLDAAPAHMPESMPMSPAAAPLFSKRYPEAAIIFDNLHSLHDVVADILASPTVPRSSKREVILRAAASYRDDTTAVTTRDEWWAMAQAMGGPPHR